MRFYIVDRGVDNNADPDIIDGKMYELTSPPIGSVPPTAHDDTVSTAENTPVTIDAAANDTDPNGNLNPTSANTNCTICEDSVNGTLVNNGDGTFTYSPDAGFTGSDGFVYEICDTDDLCDTASVTITVNGSNTQPVVTISAPPDEASYQQGETITFTGSATDAEEGDLTASLAWQSNLDGQIGDGSSFTRSDLSVGTHTITATASDSGGLTGASQVTITGFKSTSALNVDMSAASGLRGDIEAGDARLDVSDASQVTLRGSAGDLTVDDASGASTVDLGDFTVANANVGARDASEVTVNASGTLDVDASGASHVYYVGSPTLGTVDTSGESSVEQK